MTTLDINHGTVTAYNRHGCRCDECPARDACADHGLDERHGVWGGTSEKERRRLRRKVTQHTSPAA